MMPVQFFKKEAKPSLFKPKTIFRHKYAGKSKTAKKEPPKRIFKARKVTFWTIFCATVLFPLVLKIVRAANITGQHGMAVNPPGSSPAGAAGVAAAGVVGAAGAVAAGSIGIGVISALIAGTSVSVAPSALLGIGLLGIPIIGWIILAVIIIAIAVLMALSMAGVINCESCSTCGGQQAVAGQPPTSQDTSAVQQGASQQASYGS